MKSLMKRIIEEKGHIYEIVAEFNNNLVKLNIYKKNSDHFT